jgi:uncharacterized membrane protein
MEELFKVIAGYVALGVEGIGTSAIAFGALQAVFGLFRARTERPPTPFREQRKVWVRFGVWLMFGLEFELAADIIRSAISPTWRDIGQLAAIAAIRTGLNVFLERDIESIAVQEAAEHAPVAQVESPEKVRGATAAAI